MKLVVGVGDMKLAWAAGDIIVTHALGSCLGIAVYDPVAVVGGLLHVMMPQASINPAKAQANPFMFVDTGVPAFFRSLYEKGVVKQRARVFVAGGANINDSESDRFAIGRRNHAILRKLFWQNGILAEAEDVGGAQPRTMYLEIGSGRVWLSTGGCERMMSRETVQC